MKNTQTYGFARKVTGGLTLTAMLMAMVPMAQAANMPDAQIITTGGVNRINETGVEYTLTFTPIAALDALEEIDVTFPAGFDISAATAEATNLGGDITASSSAVAGQVLTVTLDTVTAPFTDLTTVVIEGVDTPATAGFYDVLIATPADDATVTFNVGPETSVALTDNAADATADYTITLTGIPALDENDVIRLTFPDEPGTGMDLTGASVTSVTGGVTGTILNGISGNYVDLTVDAASTIDGGATPLVIVIDTIDNPSQIGSYGIGVDIYADGLAGDLLAQGIAMANIGNAVQVTAVVTEALILTLSGNAVSLSVDPAYNDGQDKTQSTLLRVFNNALNGYVIQGRLDDGSGNARLVDGNGNDIPSDSVAAVDNYFGYSASNDATANTADAVRGFTDTDSTLFVTSDATTPVSTENPTDPDANALLGGEHRINYDLNVSFLTPAGIYTGTIFYTAVANF